jgi:LemA protein
MKGGTLALLVIALLVGFVGCNGCATQNRLVDLDENVNAAWGNLQASYQRRADLVPNLVATVRGAADFEQETLTQVTEARSRATGIQLSADDLSDPAKVRQFQEAQSALSSSLGRLLAVSENYPQLRATDAFRDLQAQLEGTENRINTERGRYNEAVTAYNGQVRRFPGSLFAGFLGFQPKQVFQADAGAERAPQVQF